jgi:hypothetical protein
VLSELFGLGSPYSERAERLRRELVALERKVIAGRASEAEAEQYEELSERLNSSLLARTDQIAARLRSPDESGG